MSEIREKGLALFGEVRGETTAAEVRRNIEAGGFMGAMLELAMDFAFGTVWTRAGLERKQRSLVTIGILIAQRQTTELKGHIRIGLANGLTKLEIEEAILQSVPYAGFPASLTATEVMVQVFREAGLDTETKTPEERGLH
jgi:4-carboxymuconolactone decarboxylase